MVDSIRHIARQLAESEDPHERYKILLNVYERPAESREIAILRDDIAASPLVSTLLAERRSEGIALAPHARWRGAHWVLHVLADLGSAAGDSRLLPLRDQVYQWLHDEARCEPCSGTVEGHALHYLLFLGLADQRTDVLAERLVAWTQTWNPGKTPLSFAQGLAALRGLYLHAQQRSSVASADAATRLSEDLLSCHLYKKPGSCTPLSADFTSLHYPCYEQADVLFAIKVMAEVGRAEDPRCRPAIDLLKSKQLADGTFPAERKYYRPGRSDGEGDSLVNWGGTHKARGNTFVTLEALGALHAAGERF